MKHGRLPLSFLSLFLIFFLLHPLLAQAKPEYSNETGFTCIHCHIDASGGNQLTPAGERFLAALKSKGLHTPPSALNRLLHVLFGYVHMMSAILWFGTIMYVHILLKPAYASRGLPKGELRVGWISMILVLISGIVLTISRMPSWESFYANRFGILLSIKIALFMLMFSSAIIVTLFIGPKLRKQKTLAPQTADSACTIEGLCSFDGKEGHPAYISYRGIIYDVSKSSVWKNGLHMMKHAAGNDLTEMLKDAPHGEDKVLGMPQIGKLVASEEKTKQPFHVRLFYMFAYMNLVLVFIITFVIALWRWW